MFKSKNELSDVISVLVYCPHDSTFLLILNPERGDYWIPSSKINSKYSWKDNLQIFKKQLFDYEIINEKLLKIYKIWTLEREYFHLIFQVNLPKEVKMNCKTDTSAGKLGWFSCTELAKLRPFLRSLEILEVTHIYRPKIYRNTEKVTGETVPMGCLTEIRETDILIDQENCDSQVYLNLLDSAGFPTSEQYDLYEDYIIHTYPCIYMNFASFYYAMKKFYVFENVESLFQAADVWKRDFLTFQDFLFLIAVMDPCTTHYGHVAEVRCQYIFRYYNKTRSGKLDYNGFYNMISDIQLAKKPDLQKLNIEKQVELTAKSIGFKSNSLLTFDHFYSYVLETKIRDTALLLRLEQSHCDFRVLDLKTFRSNKSNKIIFSSAYNIPQQQNGDSYSIILNTTILKPGDTPLQIKDIRLLEDTMTKSVEEDFKVLSNIKLMRPDSVGLEEKINELLLSLRYFCTEIRHCEGFQEDSDFEEKDAYSWGSAYIEKLGITLIMMCEQLKCILSNEPRLLEIEPPVFIMGDLHGNFHDLICFEKTLWPNGISLAPTKLLFLGDYVDRGMNSLEVVMYLFANKIQNPKKLFLIRGNHEIREIQKIFTFQKECVFKYGNTLGTSIWKAVNEVFDFMPLAAVIDHKVFCCHGGIPPPWLCPVVASINSIPCPLVNTERQSPLAWTIMWNDPLKTSVPRNSLQQLELVSHEGFIPNYQRGTAFYFSCDALDRFLWTNKLSHVVRAHEVVRAGFQVHQKGKLLTVFSSSGYCGGRNFAGSILVADKLLRVCMVDTGIE